MRIVFFGTPNFSVPFLQALIDDEDLSVSAVVCQPDKPVGRTKTLTAPPIKKCAKKHEISVFQPASLKQIDPSLHATLAEADAFVVVAYGKIIPQPILDLPRLGSINVHPSLLPLYRGPSPMQAAIVNQDTQTGISIMLLDEKMDHGPILAQTTLPLSGDETYPELQKRVESIGAPLLVETIKKYASGTVQPAPQDHSRATRCHLLSRDDGEITKNMAADEVYARWRAFTPWPGIWMNWNDKRLKLHAIQPSPVEAPAGKLIERDGKLYLGTKTQAIQVLELQPEGKPKMSDQAFLAGYPI